ncbi:MAG: glycoside hydrolase family 32 protein [Treponema sp.]|nr:glycoside hydrolase family 32 protein [Treponema sp.]
MKNCIKNYRPFFHFSTPKGWCNDPNGFSFFKNTVHLFYQYNPHDTKWGPMHWGHASSKDLLHWKNLSIALKPKNKFDDGGCFSGTAIEDKGKHIILYTGVQKLHEEGGLQQQCLAIGNGKSYKKYKNNPVISAKNIPFDYDKTNFRDPKLFKKNGSYYAVCMLVLANGLSSLVGFKSPNLLDWDYLNVIDYSRDGKSSLWECPDFFNLDGKDLILISAKDMKADKDLGFFQGDNNLYITGKLDSSFVFHRETRPENNYTAAPIDYGIDFYAQQTCLLPDGRRILIAWMQNWESYITPSYFNWTGMMTLPRELYLIENRLVQKPTKEFQKLKKEKLSGSISNCEFKLLDDKSKRAFEIEIYIPKKQLEEKGLQEISLNISSVNKEYINLTFNFSQMTITFDRSHTNHGGQTPSRTCKIPALLPLENDQLTLHIIGDRFSLETYLNQGEFWFTNAYFMDSHESKISLESNLQSPVNFSFYKL